MAATARMARTTFATTQCTYFVRSWGAAHDCFLLSDSMAHLFSLFHPDRTRTLCDIVLSGPHTQRCGTRWLSTPIAGKNLKDWQDMRSPIKRPTKMSRRRAVSLGLWSL